MWYTSKVFALFLLDRGVDSLVYECFFLRYLQSPGLFDHPVRLFVQVVTNPDTDICQLLKTQVSNAAGRLTVVENLEDEMSQSR